MTSEPLIRPRSAAGKAFLARWDELITIARDQVGVIWHDGSMNADSIRRGVYDADIQFAPPCAYVFLTPGSAWITEKGDRHGRLATATVFIGVPPMASSDLAIIAGVDAAHGLLELYQAADLVFSLPDTPIAPDTVTPQFTAVTLDFLTTY